MAEEFSNIEVNEPQSSPVQDFWESLRHEVHWRQKTEILDRINTNPIPSHEENAIGAFIEELEPQVRDAILTFYKKGYSTDSSGFYGIYGEYQCIDGMFTIAEDVKRNLEDEGFVVELTRFEENHWLRTERGWTGRTKIKYFPPDPNLGTVNYEKIMRDLKTKWDKAAEILPDTGTFAKPSTSHGSQIFRERFVTK